MGLTGLKSRCPQGCIPTRSSTPVSCYIILCVCDTGFLNFIFKKIYWSIFIYSAGLVSGVQGSESVIHIHISTRFRFFFHIGHSIFERWSAFPSHHSQLHLYCSDSLAHFKVSCDDTNAPR